MVAPERKKLYSVVLRGWQSPIWVLATSPNAAVGRIQSALAAANYGFAWQRELHTIELIAVESPDENFFNLPTRVDEPARLIIAD